MTYTDIAIPAALDETQGAKVRRARLGALHPAVLPLLVLFMLTLAIRWSHFGSPDVDFDEPFYLLVGDRMWHGAIPYVDIWDRKPVGLFVLYAAIRALGGAGFYQYLIVAALFVAATAGFIWALATRWIGRWAAILPAITYVVWLEPYSGGGGQTAAFYNLMVITAFWLLVRARETGQLATTVRNALISMLLIGCAIQIKYTVLPEGAFFGVVYLWLMHAQRARILPLVAVAVGMVALALAPTLAAALWYWRIGHLHEFIYANFTSTFERGRLRSNYVLKGLRFIVVVATPLAGVAVFGFGRMIRSDRGLFFGWLAAAIVGFAMIGNFYHYYFMPVLVPLAVCCAPNLIDRRWGVAVFAMLLAWPFVINQVDSPRDSAARIASLDRLAQRIQPHIDASHCLYVFDGPAALYMMTNSCLPTRFAYPDHLSNDVERPALGTDATLELKRVLANRPGAIVTGYPRLVPVLNHQNVTLMEQILARDYYPVTHIRHSWRVITVWALRDPAKARAATITPVHLYPKSITVTAKKWAMTVPSNWPD